MRKWGLMIDASQRFSLAWTDEKLVWVEGTEQTIKLSTYHLIMVIIVSQHGNNLAGYRANLRGKSQEGWCIFCKVLPASIQKGLNKAQWDSFSWCWHYPPFPRANVCGASSIEETFALLPQASIPSEIPHDETWAHWPLLLWASSNFLVLSQELCSRKGELWLCIEMDSNSKGSSHLGPCGLYIQDHPAHPNSAEHPGKGKTRPPKESPEELEPWWWDQQAPEWQQVPSWKPIDSETHTGSGLGSPLLRHLQKCLHVFQPWSPNTEAVDTWHYYEHMKLILKDSQVRDWPSAHSTLVHRTYNVAWETCPKSSLESEYNKLGWNFTSNLVTSVSLGLLFIWNLSLIP